MGFVEENPMRMLSALLMLRRLAVALRYALAEEEFSRILPAAAVLTLVGTLTYTLGAGWSVVDGFYVAVATLTTSSIADPKLAITDPWLKIFTAFYVLVGIGILVEVARRAAAPGRTSQSEPRRHPVRSLTRGALTCVRRPG